MAGIYIHIPFCKQRCSYCDFYTRVAPRQIDDTVNSIVYEMELRHKYLKNEPISTIYFGGGTPSLLNADQFKRIFDKIQRLFSVNSDAEITFEANPDDLSTEFFQSVKSLPFNRISIGIQSFDNQQLKLIHRRHSGEEAIQAVQNARKAGFNNISIDLIYGLPHQDLKSWAQQLDTAFSLRPEHISSYGLTYEAGTPLHKMRELGKVTSAGDAEMVEMHRLLLQRMAEQGYEAYEISNFAKPGFRSQHNSAYWNMTPYLGLGPSAHSFNGDSRQWNVSSIKQYNQAVFIGQEYFETEHLTLNEKYNEYIMVSLRTSEGIDLKYIAEKFGQNYLSYVNGKATKHLQNNYLQSTDQKFSLTISGIFISNLIIEDFMFV